MLWLDADDRVDEANRGRLRMLLETLPNENVGFVMKCLCLPDPKTGRGAAVDHVRLFRRHPALRWRYRVHEQILPGLRALGGTVRWSDVVVLHTGYQDAALRQTKLQRDFRLLCLEHEENGGDPFVLFNLGMILHEWGRWDEALPYLNESLRQSHPSDSIVRKLYALISQCHRLGGRLDDALASCLEGQGHYPHDVELLFHESVLRKLMGDRPGAEGCLLRLQFANEGDHFASVNPVLRSAIARHNLGVLYREEGRDAEAETYWQAVVADNSDYVPSWIGLAELYLSQGRWTQFEEALAWLEADGRAAADAAMLRARAWNARGNACRRRWN